MALIAKEKGGMELIPEGIYLATCVWVIDLWTQTRTFKEQEKQVHEIRFEFELPTMVIEYEDKETKEKKTFTKTVWQNFTLSLSSKWNMRSFLESWRWKKFTKEELEGFNVGKVLWVSCQLQILHSEDGKYANIANVLPLMTGTAVQKWTREPIIFSIDEDAKGNPTGYDEAVFAKLPQWLQDKIMESAEMKKLFWVVSIEDQEKELKWKSISEVEASTEAARHPVTQAEVDDVFAGWVPVPKSE